ncbi:MULTISPECIES: hypothetical protein [Amycolatopsis]|uniref:Uncharacterized protein n=1 Tax=Amycolatopsis eburnea TaxID=2267691 RepID=A0A3R9DWE9_9PSEU|nr:MULTISPECIES: hypothetical protein [Amycolatopsis]NBH02313.1 hypothetical protein [Amycolatopsis sp. SID8362]NED39016.1 hypothetical protein [Amycolatopsis sp. SID8362]RSD13516.1 hypothetical protein EIY87_27775 [Amycolatopsis eburnea]
MTAEVWRYERAIPTTDATGRPTRVVVGLVEQGNRLSAALRVDDGKAALVPLETGGELLKALRETLESWWRLDGHRDLTPEPRASR